VFPEKFVILLPQHAFTSRVAVLWVLACVAILLVMLSHSGVPGDSRSGLEILVPLYFLSFPLGHIGLMAGIEVKLALYVKGEPLPGILHEGLFLWTSMTVLGYAQWFLLLPWLARKCRQLSDFLVFGRNG
jgi:hypothetical protein